MQVSQPEPFETQNVHDDDAQVLDSLFLETDTPPDLKLLQMPINVKVLQDPPKITRMLTGVTTLDANTTQPAVLFNSDALRTYLFVRVESLTAVVTDGVRFADDIGMVKSAGIVCHGKTVQMDPHTGPLYAWPAAISAGGITTVSAPVMVSWWAVSA